MISPAERIFALAIHVFGRCGVPLFLFLTGYLVLSKQFNTAEDIKKFYKTHVLPLIITCSIWGIIYYITGLIVYKRPCSIIRLLLELLFFNNYEGSQFWYIPCIVGIYIFIPFVSMTIRNIDKKFMIIPLLSLIYISIPATLDPILSAIKSQYQLYSIADLSWSGGQYGILVLIGYLISQTGINKNIRKWAIVTGIISFSFALWEENFCFTHLYAYDIWYINIAIICVSISIFIIILSNNKIKSNKIITWISKNSFGIYLVHNLFRDYFSMLFEEISYFRKFILLFTLVTFCSILLVWILGLNKKIARIMMNCK